MRAAALAVLLLLQSCAFLFDGDVDLIRFESTPPGARVIVDGKTGVTPVELVVSKRVTQAVIEIDGQTETVQWARGFHLLAGILDIIPGAIFYLVPPLLDLGTGALFDQPDVVHHVFADYRTAASPKVDG